MTADTGVRIASISKVVEGMAAMKLAQDGILDLDAPLSSYWGEHAQNSYSLRQPSPRSLMTHSSTLKDLGDDPWAGQADKHPQPHLFLA